VRREFGEVNPAVNHAQQLLGAWGRAEWSGGVGNAPVNACGWSPWLERPSKGLESRAPRAGAASRKGALLRLAWGYFPNRCREPGACSTFLSFQSQFCSPGNRFIAENRRIACFS